MAARGALNLKTRGGKMRKAYAVYWNTGAAEGGIEVVDLDNRWSMSNPGGWTCQHIGGVHDHCDASMIHESRHEAEAMLDELYRKSK
jgi:hypothetical protein